MTLATRIGDEGARYNLGNMRSTIGNPVLALGVLQASYQARFKFSIGKEDRTVGARRVVDRLSGEVVTGHGAWRSRHRSVRAWPHLDRWHERPRVEDAALGRTAGHPRANHDDVPMDDRFTIAVPSEMREIYQFNSGSKITTVATYGRFRRFDVRADENIRLPIRTVTDFLGEMFVELPAGRFTMGSAGSELGRNADETLHDVTIDEAVSARDATKSRNRSGGPSWARHRARSETAAHDVRSKASLTTMSCGSSRH